MIVTRGDISIAVDIMREAAAWLLNRNMPLWRLEDLTEEKVLAGLTPENACVGWVGDEPAAAMIFQWNDPFFWPHAIRDSAFIHKLSVRRRFAGTGVVEQLVDWAKEEAARRGRRYLRLDTAGDRPKLCACYEHLGFRQVDRRMLGVYDTAFYELELH